MNHYLRKIRSHGLLPAIGFCLSAFVQCQLAAAAEPLLYPVLEDKSHSTVDARKLLTGFFDAKSTRDSRRLNDYFSREQIIYIDATLGRQFRSYPVLSAAFSDLMPHWPAEARSYPTRIIGDQKSALVAFTDTPELFGGEIRILAAVDFKDGKIVRWVDYWDGRNFGTGLAQKLRVPEASYPADLGEKATGEHASTDLQRIARALSDALGRGSALEAAEMFSYDASFEDMTLRAQVLGRPAIQRFLERALATLPYGSGSPSPIHVVGDQRGGGFEWTSSDRIRPAVRGGITALELRRDGKINRLTAVWDASKQSAAQMEALASLLVEP